MQFYEVFESFEALQYEERKQFLTLLEKGWNNNPDLSRQFKEELLDCRKWRIDRMQRDCADVADILESYGANAKADRVMNIMEWTELFSDEDLSDPLTVIDWKGFESRIHHDDPKWWLNNN